MEDEIVTFEKGRKQLINIARGKRLQEFLDQTGYFKLDWSLSNDPTVGAQPPIEGVLVNVIIDYLHFAQSEGRPIERDRFQQLVLAGFAIFEKER